MRFCEQPLAQDGFRIMTILTAQFKWVVKRILPFPLERFLYKYWDFTMFVI